VNSAPAQLKLATAVMTSWPEGWITRRFTVGDLSVDDFSAGWHHSAINPAINPAILGAPDEDSYSQT
jgi:hypothetical protein